MAQRNDQVFQLSLTELAFTIIFILLLLLGYLIFSEQRESRSIRAKLVAMQRDQGLAAAMEKARDTLAATLKDAGVPDPNAVITKMIAVEDVRAERDQLKQKVADLDAKLTSLIELSEKIKEAAKMARPDATQEQVDSAMALQAQVKRAMDSELALPASPPLAPTSSSGVSPVRPASRATSATAAPSQKRPKDASEYVKQAIAVTKALKEQLKQQLDKELPPGQETKFIESLVAASKRINDAPDGDPSKTIEDLRGQVKFLEKKLGGHGGRDFPPCWVDSNAKIQYLFLIETKPDAIVVTPSWPPTREADARDLPGMAEVLSGSPHSYNDFFRRIQGIFAWSKQHNPECRHYAQIKSAIPEAVQSDRVRLQVENYFYKYEILH